MWGRIQEFGDGGKKLRTVVALIFLYEANLEKKLIILNLIFRNNQLTNFYYIQKLALLPGV
jgi:hypothetical protein